MSILKPVLILAILSTSLLCNNAWATDPPPRAGADKPVPEAKAGDKAKAAPAKARPKRRAVRQIVEGMPPRAAPPELAVPAPPSVPAPVLPQPLPSPQTQDGNYKGGVGNALIGPGGKLCSNNGITVQCF
jgi:hypothetical protein